MATERSDRVYDWREASTKFDYFVTGAAVALVGYLGGSLEVVELAISPLGLQATAAGAFLISVWAGFKRIEKNVTIFKVMHKRLYSEEAAGALMDAVEKGGPMFNTATGEVLDQLQTMDRQHFTRRGSR